MKQARSKREFRARERSYSERAVDTREPLERFLIVCEGESTEPNYFRSFRVPRDVIDVRGVGQNTVGVVKCAIELAQEDDYDQVWCVFDRNSFPPDKFNEGLQLAVVRNIRVAYSNEAFELWYLLHFNFCDAALSRSEYAHRLTIALNHPYGKNSRTMYEELCDFQPTAIRNATLLLSRCSPRRPADDNPSTTVHLLVQELNRFLGAF